MPAERTDAQRLKHRDEVRERRAEIRRDREFERFCAEAEINPSPSSSLRPEYWRDFQSPYEGLSYPPRAPHWKPHKRARKKDKLP